MTTATAPRPGSFLQHGVAELGRRLARRRLRAQLKVQAAARQAALRALGQAAWTAGVDLSPFATLREQIAAGAAQAGAASQASEQLARERSALEAERRATAERLDAERRAIDQRRQPIDAAARAARQARQAGEATVARSQAHLAAIVGKLAGTAAGAPEEAGLRADQARHAAEAEQARAALPALVLDDTRLDGEAKAVAAEIAAFETRRRDSLAGLDRRLAELRQAASAALQHAGNLKSGQDALYASLGEALHEAASRGGPPQPLLAAPFAALHAVDRARADIETELAASQAETARMPPGAMSMFWSLVTIGVLLLVALIAGAWWWQQQRLRASEAAVAAHAPAATPGTRIPATLAPGQCARQDAPVQGPGVAVFSDCTRWEGTFLQRRLHGPGKKLFANGERLEGDFWNGYLDGTGVHARPDGSRREGTFTGGRLYGQGKVVDADGTSWEGRFWNNEVVGFATRRTRDGVIVAGDWRMIEGRPMPIGTMLRVTPDGRREKVEATALEPRMAQIAARVASQPAPADPSAY